MSNLSSSKPTVLIVGTSFRTTRQYLLDNGYEYVTLRDKIITKNPGKRLKRRVVCDFSSEATILEAISELKSRYKVDAVQATYENYIRPAAQIAAYLGLPGIPYAAAEACTDKFLMRQLFGNAPEKISPDFAIANSEADVRAFADEHSFPLILKPANLAKSLLVTKNHDLDELLKNYHHTMENIERVYARYAPNNEPKIIIEEFMIGSIHSVDAFVDSEGTPHVLEQVVDYQTGYDVGYNDNFHYSRLLPSKLSAEQIAAVRHAADLGCRALGMRNSPAHVEVILTETGPMIVEIGARNGGYRERMHGIANGIDINRTALQLLFGETPEITAERNDCCAVLELFPKIPGVFKELAGESGLASLPSLVSYDVKATPGNFIGKSSDGYKMAAMIMLHNADPEQFAHDLNFVNESVYVVTED